jgi:hypothetical protein
LKKKTQPMTEEGERKFGKLWEALVAFSFKYIYILCCWHSSLDMQKQITHLF